MSRRSATLLTGAVIAVATVLALMALSRDESVGRPQTGDTRQVTLTDRDGDGALELGPGEAPVDRTELAPSSRPQRAIASFAQISDAHVRDEESPARVPFLDRLGPPFTSVFRPQEALTTQVLVAAVRALDRFHLGPVVVTGDLIDNAQSNELTQAVTALNGGRVHPNSGAPDYEGVQSAGSADPLFYRPDVDAPRRPGLLDAAQVPFRSPGLRAPWYPELGNHDLLVQGELLASARVARQAVGARRLTGIDPNVDLPRSAPRNLGAAANRLLDGGFGGRYARVARDPSRRLLSARETIRRLRFASDLGSGNPKSALRYGIDLGPRLRGIVLDTVSRQGGSEGVVGPGQLAWLEQELRRARLRGMYAVVFSHQPLDSFASGRRVLEVLAREPIVVAAISGHTHRNRIRPRRSPAGGLWLVSTASLADHPEQARAFRLMETANGRVVLETWMVDHDGAELAGESRELAFLDAQGGRPDRAAGERPDRNARLYR